MIDRKNFIPALCIAFTCLILGKVIFEGLMKHPDQFYVENILYCFVISVCATFVLSLHKFFINVPLLFLIIGQYLVVIGLAFLIILVGSIWNPVSPGGYQDIFFSVTIPYIIGAIIYYINYFNEVKHANQILNDLKKDKPEQ